LRDIRCLVTGASGFLGVHLLAALARAGAHVAALSRLPRIGPGPTRWRALDLEDRAAVDDVIAEERPEVIFHLASLVAGKRDLELVLPTFHANLASTVHVLAAATKVGCRRVVLAGSMEEPEPGRPAASPYAAAKAAATLYADFFRAAYGTPVVAARIFMVYGPGQRDLAKVVPASILAALDGRRPRISSGARAVDWIYVEDVVEGLLALGQAEEIEGETLDLGSGRLTTVRDVVERICRQVGVPGPEVGALPDRLHEVVRRAEPEHTRARTGWSPRTSLDEGLARTIESYRADREAGKL
jgi:nucleoside-diphosphate-sugar epimerase